MSSLIAVVDSEENVTVFNNLYDVNIKEKKISLKRVDEKPNFYGENIEAFLCLAGKNGSGKTTFLTKIFNAIIDQKENETFLVQIYEYSGKLIVINPKNRFSIEFQGEEIENDSISFVNDIFVLKYSASLETTFNSIDTENKLDISNTKKLNNSLFTDVLREDMFAQIRFVVLYYEDYLSKDKKLIDWSNKVIHLSLNDHGEAIIKMFDRYFGNLIGRTKINFKHMKDTVLVNSRSQRVRYALCLKMLIIAASTYENNVLDEILGNYNATVEYETILDILIEKSEYHDDLRRCRKKLDILLSCIKDTPRKTYCLPEKSDFKKLKEMFNEYDSSDPFVSDLYSVFFVNWEGISSGEYNLLNLFGRLTVESARIKRKMNPELGILLIDEADLGYHPEWQRRWMTIVPNYVSKIFKNIKMQYIISTHSPILLSDIRDKDVLLLPNESTNTVGKTFGQNIHQLLSLNFFMENSIGQFSQEIISELFEMFSSPWEQFQKIQMADLKHRSLERENLDDLKERYLSFFQKTCQFYVVELECVTNEYFNQISADDVHSDRTLEIAFNHNVNSFLNQNEVVKKYFVDKASRFLGEDEQIGAMLLLNKMYPYIEMIGEEFYRGRLLRKYDEYLNQFSLVDMTDEELDQEITRLRREKDNRINGRKTTFD